MTRKAMFVMIIVSMLSVLCAACGSCPEGAKIVDGYCVNGSGQRVESIKPDFSQIQESTVGQAAGSAIKKANEVVEKSVVPAAKTTIDQMKQQVGGSVAAQAANNATQGLCAMYACDEDGDVRINPVTGEKIKK